LDTSALIQRAEREVADGNRSARSTVERARRKLLKERDAEGLTQLLELAGRLDNGGDLPYAIRQNLKFVSRHQLQDRPRRRVLELVCALIIHSFGALTWFAFMAFAADAGSTRQSYAAIGIGAATWLVAALLMVWLWRSGRSRFAWVAPFVWWFPSWILAFAIVYGLNGRM
jgi:hypothetical protein